MNYAFFDKEIHVNHSTANINDSTLRLPIEGIPLDEAGSLFEAQCMVLKSVGCLSLRRQTLLRIRKIFTKLKATNE